MSHVRLLIFSIIITLGMRGKAEERESDTVVIVHAGDDERFIRLQAELGALGYQSIPIVNESKSLTPLETESILKSNRAIALINITMETKGVEIWVSGTGAQRGTLVETVGSQESRYLDATMILKSVETLRANLMRFDNLNTQETAKIELADKQNSPPPPPPEVRKSLVGLFLDSGVSTLYGFTEFTPPICFGIGLTLTLGDRVAFDFGLKLPVLRMTVENSVARAEVWYFAATVGLRAFLVSRERNVVPWLGASIGPSLLRINGVALGPHDADTDTIAHTDTIITGTLLMKVGLDVSITRRIALQLDVGSGWHLRKPRIQVARDKVEIGNPLIGGSLGISIELL